MERTYVTERRLESEITGVIADAVPQVEVLAVELLAPSRFCVYIDHPDGVDLDLCERVTRHLLRDYNERYTIDVSSPGPERPLRRPEHFRKVVGRQVTVRTADDVAGRRRFRGAVVDAGDRVLTLAAHGGNVDIPYDQLVRGNLVDEGGLG